MIYFETNDLLYTFKFVETWVVYDKFFSLCSHSLLKSKNYSNIQITNSIQVSLEYTASMIFLINGFDFSLQIPIPHEGSKLNGIRS